MWKTCAQSHRFGLGRVEGGGDTIGGGVGEPRTGIIYMYFCHCKYVCEYVYIKKYLYIHIYIYMHIYMCMHMYIKTYLYVHIYK